MDKKKILIIFGTRPEAIKMVPLVKQFRENVDLFDTKVCVTAQHRELLDQVLDFFEVVPDYDLNLMKKNQSLSGLTSRALIALQEVFDEYTPDFVYVHGDTTTSFVASLVAFYNGVKVCHVEAGLRTNNKLAPYPEELNRQLTGRIADYHFAPTKRAKDNLLSEKVDASSIIVTGNTVIDSLHLGVRKINGIKSDQVEELEKLIGDKKHLILVTGHRRENFGDGFLNICKALKEIARDKSLVIIYPVHLNPNVQTPVYEILGELENVHLIKPMPYEMFVWLMNRSYIIITDSGGVQEEAPSLGKPVLVMRETTERPEAVEEGTVILVGTDVDKIVSNTRALLNEKDTYIAMSKAHNPYGDGNASKRILEFQIKLIED